MIIWLASFAKSGNTFYRIVYKHIFQKPTYTGRLFDSGDETEQRFTGYEVLPVELTDAFKNNNREIIQKYHDSDEVYLIKTHHLAKSRHIYDLPAVVVVRDPRETMVSFAWYQINCLHLPERWKGKSFKHRKRIYLEKMLLFFGLRHQLFYYRLRKSIKLNQWSFFYKTWIDRTEGKQVFVRYEDLIKAPVETVKKSLDDLNARLDIKGDKFPDFNELKKSNPKFFRKGKVDSWREEFPKSLLNRFCLASKDIMEHFNYDK